MSLREAYEFIKDEDNWTQHAMYRTADGLIAVDAYMPGVRACALGALRKFGCHRDDVVLMHDLAEAMFGELLPKGPLPLSCVNDRLGHAAVLQVFEKALVQREGSL